MPGCIDRPTVAAVERRIADRTFDGLRQSSPEIAHRAMVWSAGRTAVANQFVVQLTNQPGALATLSEALAARGIDVRAIGGGGLGDVGHVIMTTTDDEGTRAVLEAGGYTFVEGESILAEVEDKPGGMARIARQLSDAGVNIRGHLFLGRWGDRAMLGFVVDKPDVARPILERKD
jgi:hypothetical protein